MHNIHVGDCIHYRVGPIMSSKNNKHVQKAKASIKRLLSGCSCVGSCITTRYGKMQFVVNYGGMTEQPCLMHLNMSASGHIDLTSFDIIVLKQTKQHRATRTPNAWAPFSDSHAMYLSLATSIHQIQCAGQKRKHHSHKRIIVCPPSDRAEVSHYMHDLYDAPVHCMYAYT